ncbi:hypothetical protein E2C01_033521 [Portunus trituberculatus]|uniref:Uncharacterized protein n=1 Tax=Portunus trituberculatus TaxID=210409 RepID=A0A5B7F4B0_PORTR|nr:hypothetical protein [Portunus trituberculatus]
MVDLPGMLAPDCLRVHYLQPAALGDALTSRLFTVSSEAGDTLRGPLVFTCVLTEAIYFTPPFSLVLINICGKFTRPGGAGLTPRRRFALLQNHWFVAAACSVLRRVRLTTEPLCLIHIVHGRRAPGCFKPSIVGSCPNTGRPSDAYPDLVANNRTLTLTSMFPEYQYKRQENLTYRVLFMISSITITIGVRSRNRERTWAAYRGWVVLVSA